MSEPTEPGHYWIDDGAGPTFAPRVVFVHDYTANRELRVNDWYYATGKIRRPEDYDADWIGPLEEPDFD